MQTHRTPFFYMAGGTAKVSNVSGITWCVPDSLEEGRSSRKSYAKPPTRYCSGSGLRIFPSGINQPTENLVSLIFTCSSVNVY